MAYLVTGGAGFIGSHVAQDLLARGDKVVILDNFNDYYDPKIKRNNIKRIQHDNLTVIEGDLRDVTLINDIFAEHGITHVAHLAARANVRASMEQTQLYMDVNLTGSMNIFEASKAHNVQQVVF